MTVGDKIKKIRTFRGMTQKELGLAIGLEEKGADNRIAQYETNYRVPKRELLDKMAEALRVDRQNFYTIAPGSAEDFMRTFFWLDEDSPGAIRLFQLVRNPGKTGASDDTSCALQRQRRLAHPSSRGDLLSVRPCGRVHARMAFAPAGTCTPGRSPGTNTLNGNSTGPLPVTIAESMSQAFLGGKINKTSKKPPC